MTRPAARHRILHVVDSLGIGGTESGLANVIERTRDRFDHAVCCIRSDGAIADRLRRGGIAVTVIGKAPGNDWRPPLRIARLCRRLRPHLVHTRNWGSIDGIVGARLARVPVVIHGEHGREAADPSGLNRRRNRARRALSPWVNRVVAVSEQLRRWLIEEVGIAARKVTVLKNGVDTARFGQVDDRHALRRRAGYAEDDFVIGTVGRLDPVKDQNALLEVLSVLTSTYPHLRVVIAGDGSEREPLARAIAARGLEAKAQLLGHRDDIPNVLALLDVFVLPSVGEGMCNTILEAMATGLPVIATRVGGNPELVSPGTTGLLVTARDSDALATAVAAYAIDPRLRQQHGNAGRERVREEFSLEGMIDRYVGLYDEELERHSCAA